jgi:uncharacterized membrane protein YjgN (DUF898 family)
METPANRVIRPEFTGSAKEYFRIWIVNLFFTLVTLGIYSAWAKVRKKRYFYGSTKVDGDSFDYFANPKAILKGRILAFAVFVTYALLGELYPKSIYVFWVIAFAALPWLVLRALSFNARNSAFRGLRFDFTATRKEAVRVYIGMVLVVILTLGLALPWFMARVKQFILSHHALGTTQVGCEIPARTFYGIYIKATLLLLATAVPLVVLFGMAVTKLDLPEWASGLVFVAPMAVFYAIYAAVYAYTQARTANLMWNNAYGPGIRFSSTLSARRLGKLYLGNIVAAALSAGLLIPWAVVRTLRYRLESFAMIVEGAPVHEASPALARVGAAGQELGDMFNLDLGL